MDFNFQIDININELAKDMGFEIDGDNVVIKSVYKKTDLEKAVAKYLQTLIDFGYNPWGVKERLYDDLTEFKETFLNETTPVIDGGNI